MGKLEVVKLLLCTPEERDGNWLFRDSNPAGDWLITEGGTVEGIPNPGYLAL